MTRRYFKTNKWRSHHECCCACHSLLLLLLLLSKFLTAPRLGQFLVRKTDLPHPHNALDQRILSLGLGPCVLFLPPGGVHLLSGIVSRWAGCRSQYSQYSQYSQSAAAQYRKLLLYRQLRCIIQPVQHRQWCYFGKNRTTAHARWVLRCLDCL